MTKSYDKNSVLIKLIYYCNLKREVYFKRSDVTEYLMQNELFTIPNKQGFDGNLSYFGYDIQNDDDRKRILLLRGRRLNEKCLEGSIVFSFSSREIILDIAFDHDEVFAEIDELILNKTREAGVFQLNKEINEQHGYEECSFRLFGNKKLFQSNGEYYVYPRVLFDGRQNQTYYEIVNSPNLSNYSPHFVFPLFNDEFTHTGEAVFRYDKFFCRSESKLVSKEFLYLLVADGETIEVDIQEASNKELINLISSMQYDLEGKATTRKVLTNSRLNTNALRIVALGRDFGTCVLCNVNDERLLICSHIQPWRTGNARLDVDNVITLCHLHDSLFDKGFISFDDDGNVLYSTEPVLRDSIIRTFLEESGSSIKIEVNDKMRSYFKYHRENIYLG